MRQTIGVLAVTLVCALAVAGQIPKGKIVDLSHPYDEQTVFWPTASGFKLHKEFEGVTDAGFF
jgi:hypothetical protein